MAVDRMQVLHVDDDPEFAELTREFLKRRGEDLSTTWVESAAAGIDYLDDREVECIVADYDMPEMNGIAFLEAVREEYPDLPFILFTGKGSEEVASEAVSRGVTDYLQKRSDPSQFTVLANRIENAVEQYRSKHALAASERRLALLIEESPLGIIEWDSDFRFRSLNAAATEILGYPPEELEGESWERIVPETDRSTLDGWSEALIERGQHHRINENIRADGTCIVCEWHNRVVTNEGGEVVAGFSLFQDITDRRDREEELERTNAMLAALFDTLPVAVVAEDASREVLATNRRMLELFDLDGAPEDAVGQDGASLLRAKREELAEPEAVGDRVADLVERGEPARDEVLLADGRVLIRGYEPIDLPDGDGHLWVYRDLTDRTQYEETIKALHGVATDLAQCDTREAIYRRTIDAAGALLDFDQAVVAMEEDGILEVTAMSEEIPFEERPRMREDEGIAGKTYQEQTAHVLDDAMADATAEPQDSDIRAAISVPIGTRGVFQVFDDKPGTFDERDLELTRLLVRHVESGLDLLERERQLQRQNDRLESFANVVSHDLRNPLNVAQGRLELLEDDCESEHVDGIARAHERMHELIAELLTLARNDREVTELESVALEKVATSSWEHVQTDAATLTMNASKSIRADSVRLGQLFENVFRNAIEHGGPDVHVRVGDLEGGFFIEDDGPGVDPGEREVIFESGYSTAGVGFGLAIVADIVNAHDWEITVDEATDGGACFEITGVETVV